MLLTADQWWPPDPESQLAAVRGPAGTGGLLSVTRTLDTETLVSKMPVTVTSRMAAKLDGTSTSSSR